MKCTGARLTAPSLAALLGLVALPMAAFTQPDTAAPPSGERGLIPLPEQPDDTARELAIDPRQAEEKLDYLLERAVEMAEDLPTPEARSSSLLTAAKAYAAIGDKDQAFQLLQWAFESAKKIPKGWDEGYSPRFEVLENIATEMLELDKTESAIQALDEAYKSDSQNDLTAHSEALWRVSSLLAWKKGNLDKALEIANRIENLNYHSIATSEAFRAAAATGQTKHALEIARNLQDSGASSRAIYAIAEALANAQQFDLALQIVEEIDKDADPHVSYGPWSARNSAFHDIALALIRASQPDQAIQVATKIDPFEMGSDRLAHLAEMLSRQGYFQQALQVANMARDYDRAAALTTIAQGLIKAGQKQPASEALDTAFAAAKEIENPGPRLGALISIAQALADADQKQKALQALEGALVIAPVGDQRNHLPHDLLKIAKVFLRLGELEKAKQTLDLAVKAAEALQKTDGPYIAAQFLAPIATVIAQAGYPLDALDILQYALAVRERITQPGEREEVLSSILHGLQQVAENFLPPTP